MSLRCDNNKNNDDLIRGAEESRLISGIGIKSKKEKKKVMKLKIRVKSFGAYFIIALPATLHR